MSELEERIIDAEQATGMNREQALRTLAQHGEGTDKHLATLMLAGPEISIKEEVRLNDWFPLPSPLTVAVRLALRSMANG